MTARRRFLGLAVFAAVLWIAVCLFSPNTLDRDQTTRAYGRWLKNRTAENYAAYQQEVSIGVREDLLFKLAFFSPVLLVVEAALFVTYRSKKRELGVSLSQ